MRTCALVILSFLISGCAHNFYNAGGKTGDIPRSDCNINMLLLGARWGKGTRVIEKDAKVTLRGRTSIWSPIFDYESFDNNTKWKFPGPAL